MYREEYHARDVTKSGATVILYIIATNGIIFTSIANIKCLLQTFLTSKMVFVQNASVQRSVSFAPCQIRLV